MASQAIGIDIGNHAIKIAWLQRKGATTRAVRLFRATLSGDEDAVRADVGGASVSDRDASACIANVYRRTGYVMDPHTAVAYEAANRHDPRPDAPVVVLATAHPAKFPETVEAAIGRTVPIAIYEGLNARARAISNRECVLSPRRMPAPESASRSASARSSWPRWTRS